MESVALLKNLYESRRKRNTSYSLSAFSRDVGMSQPQISRILNGSRPFTITQAKKISVHLSLDESTEKKLLESVLLGSSRDQALTEKIESKNKKREEKKAVDFDVEKYIAISKWYHLPLFALITTVDFKNNPSWIAERLGISTDEAKDAIERLVQLGFVSRVDGKLVPTNNHVNLVTKNSKTAVREHHAAMMAQAKETMGKATDDGSFALREISGVSVATDMKNVGAAKELVAKFKADMTALLSEGSATEVYQLNVQLFPITKRKKS